ncbi:mitochondrial carrier domain-containing protein [Xylaria sp. FL1777]|nr:mitochondrial carrier domain-containing protein [Xylaria sp. FL1777]
MSIPSPVSKLSPSPSTNSVLPAFHHALSGSLGTLISTCSLHPLSPLSLVIAHLLVQRQLRRRRGHALGLGPAPGFLGDHPGRGPSVPPPTPTTPALDTQQQVPVPDRDQQPKQPTAEYVGIVDAFSQIWNSDGDGGLRAFYTGLAQDAPKSVLDSFLSFLCYEWFRSLRLRSHQRARRMKGRGLGVVEELVVCMIAGAGSRSFTTSIANIITRNTLDVRKIVRSIRREKGIAGFWSGHSASLVLTLNPSLTFFLHEFLNSTFAEQTYDDPGPQLTFLFAATSKAISSFITYPFQIAKTRLQADVEGEAEENKPNTVRAMQNLAPRSIFDTVARIIQTEGIGILYNGVGAELLKGFFNHGTTMLAKDMVHKFLYKLYVFALEAVTELRRQRRTRGDKSDQIQCY